MESQDGFRRRAAIVSTHKSKDTGDISSIFNDE